MVIASIDGAAFIKLMAGGAAYLEKNKDFVDSLNVFPVPDGDTGVNMALTMNSALKEISSQGTTDLSILAKALSRGALMGARGNSGVILSQIFRGLSKGINSQQELTPADFAIALQEGVKAAYKSVMKPVEGTLLTVAREAAAGASKAVADGTEDMVALLRETLDAAEAALAKTPDLLPVLKEAGVVDAGGQGFVFILKGFLGELQGESSPYEIIAATAGRADAGAGLRPVTQVEADVKFQYCTEFLVINIRGDLDTFKQYIQQMGDSLAFVRDEDFTKVHIHCNEPHKVLSYAMEYGELDKVKIENMKVQNRQIVVAAPVKAASLPLLDTVDIVAVVPGEGLGLIFEAFGGLVVDGGQSINPSTQDILLQIDASPAKNVIVLPNNKNVILAAEQAAQFSVKNVKVVPTKTIPEGLSAMLVYNPEGDISAMAEEMQDKASKTKTGEITYAVRESSMNGLKIKAGDMLGLINDQISMSDSDKNTLMKRLLGKLVDENDAMISIFYGVDITEAEAEALHLEIEALFPDIEVKMHYGGQPVYFYIISVE